MRKITYNSRKKHLENHPVDDDNTEGVKGLWWTVADIKRGALMGSRERSCSQCAQRT